MAARDYILNNLWWKVLSLLLAALTYFTIKTASLNDQNLQQSPVVTTNTRKFVGIPITLMTAASNADRFQVKPLTVTVNVIGNADVLEKLQPKQIQAVVDVTDAPAEREFRKDIQIQIPKDLKLDSQFPIYATVERITAPK
ncbi:MAG: YbbR family protein [Pedosphaera sp.]|nr:YbbR family protein [Pedosphaera sp.]